MPLQGLASAYFLGASAEHLQRIYDEDSLELDEWEDSPQEITTDDWRDFLGDKAYPLPRFHESLCGIAAQRRMRAIGTSGHTSISLRTS